MVCRNKHTKDTRVDPLTAKGFGSAGSATQHPQFESGMWNFFRFIATLFITRV